MNCSPGQSLFMSELVLCVHIFRFVMKHQRSFVGIAASNGYMLEFVADEGMAGTGSGRIGLCPINEKPSMIRA